ncbi:TIGR04279 domain-containing protein [Methanothermococcus sp. SCGC AD-155-N22]|nr:TIGR04279 domain-containing protein [Methanothermococcus sp. SCGC AD-155-N22]
MKTYYAIVLSLLIVLSILPTSLAVDTSEKIAVVVSTPADAIVAAPYAKAMGYTLIYTPTNKLSRDAERELIRGRYSKVIIVGGPVAVSKTVENSIKNLKIKTERIWGDTRVETSIEVYKAIKREKPELARDVVIVEGFNEKISPVAVSFDAPVLYYGLNRENEVIEVLKDIRVKNAVVLGKKTPKDIVNVVSKISKNTFIASGSERDVIRTAISYIEKINPEIKNKGAVIIYAEKTKDPVINGILNFVKGYISMIIPLPSKDIGIVKEILLKVIEITSLITVSSEDPKVVEKVSDIAQKLGPVSVSPAPGAGGGGSGGVGGGGGKGGSAPPQQTPTGPAVKIVASGKEIVFMGQDNNTLTISGNYTIDVPKVEADVNVVDKNDTSKNIVIDFRDNESVETIIEAMNNFNVVAYCGSDVKITYSNSKMKGKNVSLHVITERRALRDNINKLLDGDATGLIETLNGSYNCTKTVGNNGKVEFIYKPSDNGEHIVVITEGNGVPKNAENVTVLAVGGFEVVRYKMKIEYVRDSDTVDVNITLNETPENPVRYGAVLIKKDIDLTLKIIGTNPNNNLFNVSIVGDKGEHQVVTDNTRIKLNAPEVENIIKNVYKTETVSPSYGEILEDRSYTITFPEIIPNSYIIAIAYDTKEKKIVAIAQEPLNQ